MLYMVLLLQKLSYHNKIFSFQLRTQIISDISTYPINEPEELLQNTEVMRSAMAVKDELKIDALVSLNSSYLTVIPQ